MDEKKQNYKYVSKKWSHYFQTFDVVVNVSWWSIRNWRRHSVWHVPIEFSFRSVVYWRKYLFYRNYPRGIEAWKSCVSKLYPFVKKMPRCCYYVLVHVVDYSCRDIVCCILRKYTQNTRRQARNMRRMRFLRAQICAHRNFNLHRKIASELCSHTSMTTVCRKLYTYRLLLFYYKEFVTN